MWIFQVHLPNILSDLLHMSVASLATWKNVVGTIFLVGSDKIGVVDAAKWNHGRHLLLKLSLESWLKDACTIHGLGQIKSADIPTTNNEMIGMDHWKDVMERNIDIASGLCIGTKLHGRAHNDGAIVVGRLSTLTSSPSKALTIGNDTRGDGGSWRKNS